MWTLLHDWYCRRFHALTGYVIVANGHVYRECLDCGRAVRTKYDPRPTVTGYTPTPTHHR